MTCKPKFFIFIMLFLVVTILQDNNGLKAQVKSNVSGSVTNKVFKAGASTSNITPFLGGGIIGGWSLPPSTHVHDELHARCLVLDDGETKLVFVVADLLGINRNLIDEAKQLVFTETNIPVENILISAVHAHSATSALGVGEKRKDWSRERSFDDYQKLVIRRIADAVRVAVNNLEPAQIGWGVGSVPQHVFIRRWIMKPGTPVINPYGGQDKAKMNPGYSGNLLKPAAVPDPDVSFISVRSANGKPISLLANYSLHYVGGVGPGHISADYFAVFADRIQELLKADRQDPPFVGIMSNGTSGDVTSTDHGKQSLPRYKPYEKMHVVADAVAREVMRVHNEIKFHDWVRLKAAQEELTLTVRKPDQKLIERSKMVLSRPDTVKPVHVHEKVYAERSLKLLEWPDQIDIVLQTFRIGDLGVAAIPFETFAEIGLELKARSPFKPTFTVELANGYYGYLPTPKQHSLGGYETWLGTNKVEYEASEKIVASLLKLFSQTK